MELKQSQEESGNPLGALDLRGIFSDAAIIGTIAEHNFRIAVPSHSLPLLSSSDGNQSRLEFSARKNTASRDRAPVVIV